MKITLKSLKVSATLSEETTAYTAVVCIDGKPAFHASNHGTGGCDLFYPVSGYTGPTLAEVNAWIGANMPQLDWTADGLGMVPQDLELVVGELIEQEQRQKRLQRLLKAKIVFIGQHEGKPALFTIKAAPTPSNLAQVAARKSGNVIVNGNPAAIEQALQLV